MNLIALPIVHTATRRAVQGAHAADPALPDAPRTTRGQRMRRAEAPRRLV